MGFQTTVNLQQAAAVAGDFASANPYATVVAHEGTLVAGTGGVTVARFGWASNGSVLNAGTIAPTGFLHRTQGAAVITTYLAETGNLVPAGFPVTLMKGGDFWAAITVASATVGNKAFASQTDGTMRPGAAGATISGYVETPFSITGFPVGGTGAVGELAVISA
jgi:hypothetical protein